jgi:coniferyl-aldehyde dehydrogenase
MAAAATNLCPVTLELGGKSPPSFATISRCAKPAERLLFVKCFNAGQICTTVDHIYVPEAKVAEFVEMAKEIVTAATPPGHARLHLHD